MQQLLTHLRTFFETWFGTCDIYVNKRGQLTGEVSFFYYFHRYIDFPKESTSASAFIQLATYTPPALLTRIHYVIPTAQPEQASDHIPIRPLAPST